MGQATTTWYSILSRPDSVGTDTLTTRYGMTTCTSTVTDAQVYEFTYNKLGWLTAEKDRRDGARPRTTVGTVR